MHTPLWLRHPAARCSPDSATTRQLCLLPSSILPRAHPPPVPPPTCQSSRLPRSWCSTALMRALSSLPCRTGSGLRPVAGEARGRWRAGQAWGCGGLCSSCTHSFTPTASASQTALNTPIEETHPTRPAAAPAAQTPAGRRRAAAPGPAIGSACARCQSDTRRLRLEGWLEGKLGRWEGLLLEKRHHCNHSIPLSLSNTHGCGPHPPPGLHGSLRAHCRTLLPPALTWVEVLQAGRHSGWQLHAAARRLLAPVACERAPGKGVRPAHGARETQALQQ